MVGYIIFLKQQYGTCVSFFRPQFQCGLNFGLKCHICYYAAFTLLKKNLKYVLLFEQFKHATVLSNCIHVNIYSLVFSREIEVERHLVAKL